MVNDKIEAIGCILKSPEPTDKILKKIDIYRDKHGTFIQIFNVDMVIGNDHILWAYDKARRSFEDGTNRADSLEIETLLWSSGERQIKNAIKKMGIPNKAKKIVILTDGDITKLLSFLNGKRKIELLEPSKEKLKRFGITDYEIDSAENPYDLIFEKLSVSIL